MTQAPTTLEDPRWRTNSGSWALAKILKRHGLKASIKNSRISGSKYITFKHPTDGNLPTTRVRFAHHRHPDIKVNQVRKPAGLGFDHQIRSDMSGVRRQVIDLSVIILKKYHIDPDAELARLVKLQKEHAEAEADKRVNIYVSETRPCSFGRYKEYAYLLADTDKALHKFATVIGLQRAWHQGPPKHKYSHYDLFGSKIEMARRAGATPVLIREYIKEKCNAEM